MNASQDVHDGVEYDPDSGVYHASYEPYADSPSLALVEAIAAIEGTDPVTMAPLGDAIDMEALDAVVQSSLDDDDVRVTLPYFGYRVAVRNDGVIELQPTDPGAASAE